MTDIDRLSESAIIVLVLILIVTVGATVLQTIRGTQAERGSAGINDTNNPTLANTSFGFFNFTVPAIYDGLNPSLSGHIAHNASNFTDIYQSGNYTIISATNSYNWTGAGGNNTDVNWTFIVSFDILQSDFNVSTAGLSSLVTYSDFFQVIVVIIVFAVIIGLFAFFTLRGRGSNI